MSAPACTVCRRDPERMNSVVAECSHVDCPHRRHAWSERPSRADLDRGPWAKRVDRDPWAKRVDRDPLPLDVALVGGEA